MANMKTDQNVRYETFLHDELAPGGKWFEGMPALSSAKWNGFTARSRCSDSLACKFGICSDRIACTNILTYQDFLEVLFRDAE